MAKKMFGTEWIKVCVIDPAYKKTGCKLRGYPKVDVDELFSVINFNEFMRDGYIFLWVVNAMMD